MAGNLINRALIIILVVLMLASLYYIDMSLGSGFAFSLVNFSSSFKCAILEKVLNSELMKEICNFPSGNKAISVFTAEIILFSIVMMLVSRARDRSEKKIDEFLMQTKTRLQETYAAIEKQQKNKGKFHASKNKQSASGDCAYASSISTSRYFCPIRGDCDDVTRISGCEGVDSETDASLDGDLNEFILK